jgi:hypothetical protein
MNLERMLLMAALGLTASAVSSYATTVQVLDPLNFSGQGPLLISNSGGGNQHQQSTDPVFSFNGDLPRLIFQRAQMGSQPTDSSYLQIYQGGVIKNLNPPAVSPTAPIIVGSTTSGVANPPDFLIDFGAPNNAAAQQIQNLLLSNPNLPNSIYSIVVVEVNNNKPRIKATVQFGFPNTHVVNGQLSPTFNITTQLGNG